MHHLLLASIGPVQEFIASARRCRDLWFGSWLLSELSRAAADGLRQTDPNAVQLIFPGGSARASITPGAAVANKLLARVSGDAAAVRTAAESGRRAMEQRLHQLGEAAFDRVNRWIDRVTAEAQLNDLMEYIWVAVPESAGYAAARTQAEQLLNARKAARQWSQVPWGRAGQRKSSLDGLRESVLNEKIFAAHETDRHVRLRIHPQERLCGVGLLKRLGADVGTQDPPTFFSTMHLAALPWMKGVARTVDRATAEGALSRFRAALATVGVAPDNVSESTVPEVDSLFGRLDGAALYPERLVAMAEEQDIDPAHHDTLRKALRELIRDLDHGEPSPYYGVLLADGDRMGAAIESITDINAHIQFSNRLSEFADQARSIVKQYGGSPIYAGGDDVLALVPLDVALETASDLQKAFAATMEQALPGSAKRPTLSVGVGIVHSISPMSDGLDAARDAERIAKNDAGRNALAIRLHKRGGAPLDVYGHWGQLDARLHRFRQWSHEGALSAKAAHELQSLEQLTFGVPADSDDARALRAVQQVLFKRIGDRKREAGGGASDHTRVDLAAVAADGLSPAQLGRELQVARELALAAQQAGHKGDA